jgi:hypothetical protein
MKVIKAELVMNNEKDDQAGAYTQGKSEDIDKGIGLVPGNITPGRAKVAL